MRMFRKICPKSIAFVIFYSEDARHMWIVRITVLVESIKRRPMLFQRIKQFPIVCFLVLHSFVTIYIGDREEEICCAIVCVNTDSISFDNPDKITLCGC